MRAAQFDVFANPSKLGRGDRPFIVVLQHNLISDSKFRLCAPLVRPAAIVAISRLNPEFLIDGQKLLLSPLELAGFTVLVLKKPVANLEAQRYAISGALDIVFHGI